MTSYWPHSEPATVEQIARDAARSPMSSQICVLAHRQDPERQRRAADGLYVCHGCRIRLERELGDLPGLDIDLIRAHSLSGPPKERVKGGEVEAQMPIKANIVELRSQLLASIASWARVVCEERDVSTPDLTVPAIAAFLLRHVDWIAAQPFVDEYDHEIHSLRRQAFSKAFPTGRRQFPLGDCVEPECPGTLIAVVNDIDTLLPEEITCDYSPDHRWPSSKWRELGKRLGIVISDPKLTVAQAAKIYDIPARTMARWVADGRIRDVADPGEASLVHAAEVEDLLRLLRVVRDSA